MALKSVPRRRPAIRTRACRDRRPIRTPLRRMTPPAMSARKVRGAVTTPAPPAQPTVSLTSDVTTVNRGETANLQWTSGNATSCTASGGWSGARGLSGTEAITNIQTTRTYTLTCSGAGGQASSSVTVTVVDTIAPTVPAGWQHRRRRRARSMSRGPRDRQRGGHRVPRPARGSNRHVRPRVTRTAASTRRPRTAIRSAPTTRPATSQHNHTPFRPQGGRQMRHNRRSRSGSAPTSVASRTAPANRS